LREANALVSNEQYAEALEKFIWIHEKALENEKDIEWYHFSFAMEIWKGFGEKYPPALQALKDIRDRQSAVLKSCGTDLKLFQDVVAINTCLKEESESIALFSIIMKQSPEFAILCWDSIAGYLFKTKSFEIIGKMVKDPVAEYSRYENMWKPVRDISDEPKNSDFKKMAEDLYVERVLSFIEFSTFIADKESARVIKKRALAVVDNQKIKEIIVE